MVKVTIQITQLVCETDVQLDLAYLNRLLSDNGNKNSPENNRQYQITEMWVLGEIDYLTYGGTIITKLLNTWGQ